MSAAGQQRFYLKIYIHVERITPCVHIKLKLARLKNPYLFFRLKYDVHVTLWLTSRLILARPFYPNLAKLLERGYQHGLGYVPGHTAQKYFR